MAQALHHEHIVRINDPANIAGAWLTRAQLWAGLQRTVLAPELLDESIALAGRIASNSPFGITLTKRVLMANVDAGSLRNAVEVENRGQTLATRGQDFSESLGAFREKREPKFSGR